MKNYFLLSVILLLLFTAAPRAAEVVISADGKSEYQIVLPDKSQDPLIEKALAEAADVLREMVEANGCKISVVKEAQADKKKPGVYLGDTATARAAGIDISKLPVWTYIWKTAGKNLIIAGRDWPAAKRQDGSTPCSLGTVRGLTDFMHQYCGTRFLAPGGLVGIEFLPTPKIAIPGDLDIRGEPMVNFNSGGRPTTRTGEIGLNLLDNVTTEYLGHSHEIAVPADRYADKHPEYFALVGGQRIRQHPHDWKPGVMVKEPHLCYSNKDVQELIYQDMLRSFDAGYPEYVSLQADGFQPCQCEPCKKMYDTADWGEKLWLLNKNWAERLLKDRPGKFLVVTAYTVTDKPPASFKQFPANMRICARSTPEAMASWDEYKIPGGFITYLHAWGGYHLCGYLPTRTPVFAERLVKMYDRYNVKGIGLDSPPAIMWGLEGPTIYVYSRMFDNVKANSALKLVDEYLQAAYGKAAPAMTHFFDELHHTLEAYAEVFGVDNGTFQKYTRADGRSVRYLTWQSRLRLIGFIYPPETLAILESHLAQAEKTTGLSEKNKLRLALVRREFNYLASTARVVHMYHAYQSRPNKTTLDQLLCEMESREKMIMSWYDTKRVYRPGTYLQQPIAPSWPMYIGGGGYYNTHLLANGGSYLSQPVPPFTWKIADMRKAPLLEPKKITAKKTEVSLSFDSPDWKTVPAEKLGPLSLGSPAPKWPTQVKAAYDTKNLYIRFEGQLQAGWTRPPQMRHDHEDIISCESFHVLAAPDNNPARYYRFAAGPMDTARYDARRGFIEDSIDPRFNQDDVAWNPDWRFEYSVAADAKNWSALIVIPFQSLNTSVPTAGTEWKVNFARVHQIRRYMPREFTLWSANPGTPSIDDRQAFGTLVFQ